MGSHALRVTGARRTFRSPAGHDLHAFRDLDLVVERGEILALLGPSGCGKSTLLRTVAGLDTLSAGDVAIASTRPVGLAFQEPRLLPWLDVRGNVALGLRFHANRDAVDDVDRLLEVFGIADLAGHRPDELSGGQAQRVALARAVVVRPGLLLLDEPFGALDPVIRRGLQDWLLEVRAALDVTVVLVTHDVDEALRVGDRVAVMRAGAGLVGTWDTPGPTHADAVRREVRAAYGPETTVATPPTRGATAPHRHDDGARPGPVTTADLLEVAP